MSVCYPGCRQHELEADHFAAAVLLRARVAPGALDEGMRTIARMTVHDRSADLSKLLRLARQVDAVDAAAGRQADGPSEEQRLLQALASQDPDRLNDLPILIVGLMALEEALARVEEREFFGDDTPADQKIWAVAPAMSAAIAFHHTHPPTQARIHRLRQLGTRTDMLLRSTAPLLRMDKRGRSPADRVAGLLAQAEAAPSEGSAANAGLPTFLAFVCGAAAVAAAGLVTDRA